jgi:hypothetical protein
MAVPCFTKLTLQQQFEDDSLLYRSQLWNVHCQRSSRGLFQHNSHPMVIGRFLRQNTSLLTVTRSTITRQYLVPTSDSGIGISLVQSSSDSAGLIPTTAAAPFCCILRNSCMLFEQIGILGSHGGFILSSTEHRMGGYLLFFYRAGISSTPF